jgi:HEAT repeat protein
MPSENPAFTLLREHLSDDKWRQVVLFYSGLGDPSEVVESLLAAGQTEFAACALAESASPPPELAKRVTDPLVQRAWADHDETAIAALSALRSNAATDFFSARLKERDATKRALAANILGRLQTERAVEYLLPQLRDTNADVRDQVVASLGQSKSERVIEPLLVALRGDPRVGTVDTRMRVAAARALGEIGTDKAVPALIVEIQVGEPEVRAVAVEALMKIRSELARKPLAAIVNSNQKDEVRAAAAQVLEAMDGK